MFFGDLFGLASLQVILNVFRQKPLDELLPKAKASGVAIIVRLPLASGLLAGKFGLDTQFPEGDHRHFNREGGQFNIGETFAGLPFEKGLELVKDLRSIVPQGMSMSDMSLRWILDQEAVTVVIPGASSPDQGRKNAKAYQGFRLCNPICIPCWMLFIGSRFTVTFVDHID